MLECPWPASWWVDGGGVNLTLKVIVMFFNLLYSVKKISDLLGRWVGNSLVLSDLGSSPVNVLLWYLLELIIFRFFFRLWECLLLFSFLFCLLLFLLDSSLLVFLHLLLSYLRLTTLLWLLVHFLTFFFWSCVAFWLFGLLSKPLNVVIRLLLTCPLLKPAGVPALWSLSTHFKELVLQVQSWHW